MKTNVFHLSIIPIKDILCHEEFDSSRARPLVERLKKEKYLSNPIVVASLEDGKYLQLDGMNRLSAFKLLGLKSIIAQIIDYNDQETVELSSWSHLFRINDEGNFFHCADDMGKIVVKPGTIENVGHRYIKEGFGRLCTIVTRKGRIFFISTNGTLTEKIKKLIKFVDCYKNHIVRDVLPTTSSQYSIDFLFREHPEANMMIIFPTFTRHQIVEVVQSGGLFPAGVTRHLIQRRCLNLNIPLSLFNSGTIAKQNKNLENILSTCHFRVYEEPTIYFE